MTNVVNTVEIDYRVNGNVFNVENNQIVYCDELIENIKNGGKVIWNDTRDELTVSDLEILQGMQLF